MERADLEGVMDIEEVSFPTPWSRGLFEGEISRSFSDALVAVSPNGEILGYSVCWIIADEAHLLNIAVRPESRGKGVGKRLLGECIRRSARAGAAMVHLEVRAGNREALRLYAGYGFSFKGIRRGYYTDTGEDAILLSRDLGEPDAS